MRDGPCQSEPTEDMEGLVRRYYELVDGRAFDRMLDLFDEEIVYTRPGYEALVGKAALAEFYTTVRVIESGRHEITSVLVVGDRVAVQGRFEGTLKTGQRTAHGFADFFLIGSGRFVERTTYFDAPAI
jgi:ketosteroid isomerase-like protein